MRELNYIIFCICIVGLGMNYVPKAGVIIFNEALEANVPYYYNCTNSPHVAQGVQFNQVCDVWDTPAGEYPPAQ